MKLVKTKTTQKNHWVISAQAVSNEEFLSAIKKAESGPFFSLTQAQEQLKKWKKEKGL